MYEFMFGLLIIALSSLGLFAFLKARSSIIFLCICGVFIAIGVFLFILGLIKMIIDYITSKKGELCFACVNDIVSTGKVINDKEIFRAKFIVYIGSKHKVISISEEIGADLSNYPIGSFVKVKYHNNDVNIIDNVSESIVPKKIKAKIDEGIR